MPGQLFDIQRFSVHDGPGIRTLVFLKGCNMKCIWCQNPESQNQQIEIMFYKSSCVGFGDCVKACPQNAIDLNRENRIDYSLCDGCGICVQACPTGSYKMVGKSYTAEEVFVQIKKDIPYYGDTGGVTFSGGEATIQIKFLDEVIDLCVENKIHTNIETNGLFSYRRLESTLRKLDLIYFDLKIFDNKVHKQYTGVSNRLILANAHRLKLANFRVEYRIPLIPSITDTEDNLNRFADFLLDIGETKVWLLKYHNLYESKLDSLGRSNEKLGFSSYSDSQLNYARELVEAKGLEVLT